MNAVDLRRLAERAEGVEGRQADRLSELHGRIRTARRRRTAAGLISAAVMAVALVTGGAILNGSVDRTDGPIDQTPNPKPTRTEQAPQPEPAGQVTVTPDIAAGDIQGWEVGGSLTNADPGWEGATDLTASIETIGISGREKNVVPFCNGDPDTWWVLKKDLGGVGGERNDDGSMGDGSRAITGACSPDDPTSAPAPLSEATDCSRPIRPLCPWNFAIEAWQHDEAPAALPLRMFVTGALSSRAEECLAGTSDVDACLAAHDIIPLDESDATFGFAVFEHRMAPTVMTVLGTPHQALGIGDRVQYLVDRAVVAARGAAELKLQLPATDRQLVVAVVHVETAALDECVDGIDIEEVDAASSRRRQEAIRRRCVTELALRVDGEPGPNLGEDFLFGNPQVVLPPGDAREVTVEVVKNDPANIRYALVIWEEGP